MMRLARIGSFKKTTAIIAPNSTLVSRNAETIAIGDVGDEGKACGGHHNRADTNEQCY